MASTKIDGKKTQKSEMKHQKGDENVNAVSDKAKILKQSLERANECVCLMRRQKSCEPHRLCSAWLSVTCRYRMLHHFSNAHFSF